MHSNSFNINFDPIRMCFVFIYNAARFFSQAKCIEDQVGRVALLVFQYAASICIKSE